MNDNVAPPKEGGPLGNWGMAALLAVMPATVVFILLFQHQGGLQLRPTSLLLPTGAAGAHLTNADLVSLNHTLRNIQHQLDEMQEQLDRGAAGAPEGGRGAGGEQQGGSSEGALQELQAGLAKLHEKVDQLVKNEAMDHLRAKVDTLASREQVESVKGEILSLQEGLQQAGVQNPSSLDPTTQASMELRDKLLAGWPKGKPKAVIVVLARSKDKDGVRSSMEEMEERFNKKAQYPYLFLDDGRLSPEFKAGVAEMTRAPCLFGRVPKEHWSYPDFVDQERAAQARRDAPSKNVLFGDLESYHFMCRYFSGFFALHPLLDGFDYYWRMEPNVRFFCELRAEQDPFKVLEASGAQYSWNIMFPEIMDTIPTLWDTTRQWALQNRKLLDKNNSIVGLMETEDTDLNNMNYDLGCHFWSNFEVGRLAFFRSEPYQSLFKHLDRAGGFFYERWGDAPVHSLAVALLLPRQQVHFFDEIGYQHDSFPHCPQSEELRQACSCDPKEDTNIRSGHSLCIARLKERVGIF